MTPQQVSGNLFPRRQTIAALALFLLGLTTSATGHAQTADPVIGGCLYTGQGTVTFVPDALGEPVANWSTVYAADGATPITDAQIMVQSQHDGGIVAYGNLGTGVDGHCWEAIIPATATPGTPDATDLIVTFSAPGHGTTSREFTWDAGLAAFTHPTGPDLAAGGTGDSSVVAVGAQDAYLPPLDADNQLPKANLLHYVFYDNFTNLADDGPTKDPGLNGVTVRVYDPAGNLVAEQVSGSRTSFTTADGLTYGPGGAMPAHGFVYFEGLPAGELIVESDPSTVTNAANPHMPANILHLAHSGTGGDCLDPTTGRIDYRQPGCAWYQTVTEEGGHAWDAQLRPQDTGTEAGGYLTWHGFIEKIGPDAGGNPAVAGSVSGLLIDADGNDPQEPFPATLGGRVPPTNARYADGTPWDTNSNGAVGGVVDSFRFDVLPNARIPDAIVALFTLGDNPQLVATTEATPIANYNDPSTGGEFAFTNVAPGRYEMFVFDHDLVNVPKVGTGATVQSGVNTAVTVLVPRFAARVQGFVENSGTPVADTAVKLFYESGATKQATATNPVGWFNFDAAPETGVPGQVYADLPDGTTRRGRILTEDFQRLDPNLPVGPGNPAITSITHNGMSRVVQWWTLNYFADLQLEDIPAEVGNLIGNVHYEHLPLGTWVGNGVWDEADEKLFQGVTVNLLDAAGAVIATTATGALDEADTVRQGWIPSGTFPPNEIGGVFAGPVVCDTGNLADNCRQTTGLPAPAVGYYEFRDLAPGSYQVEIVPPAGMTDLYSKFFASLNGTGSGITGLAKRAGDEDILFFDGTKFHLFFDGSAHGLPRDADIDALHVVDHDTFYLSFAGAGTAQTTAVPAGVSSAPFLADDEDIVLFDGGDWSLVFDGSAHGLGDNNGEDIDALSVLDDGRLVISTRGAGNARKPSLNPTPLATDPAGPWTGTNPRPQDEDLMVFDPVTGFFGMYFDGSDIGLADGKALENVWGAAVSPTGDIHLTTARSFAIAAALTGGGNDIFACRGASTGRKTACAAEAFLFQGTPLGLEDTKLETLDAVSLFGLGLRQDIIVTGGQGRRVDVAVTSIDVANGATYGVPMAGIVEGGNFSGNGDLDPNPTSLLFEEARAIVGAPLAVYDHYNYFLGVAFQGDPNCNPTNNALHVPGDPADPFSCSSSLVVEQGPEMERRFAPGAHRYIGNDPAFPDSNIPEFAGGPLLPGFDPDFEWMELSVHLPQAGAKFEQAWTPLTPPGGGTTAGFCVVALDIQSFAAEAGNWGVTATITLHDGFTPQAEAEVRGTWDGTNQTGCTTDASGQCTMTLEKVDPPAATVSFDIGSVTPVNPAYVYNPNALPGNGYSCVALPWIVAAP